MVLEKKTVLKVCIYLTDALSVCGGILFIVGSIVYMPSIANDFNPNLGGILFIIGSAFFFFCDLLSHFIEDRFSPFRNFRNVGSLRNLMVMIGNISFIVGSVYFLAMMPAIVGIDIFVGGSIFIWIPQALTCAGLYICNGFTAEYYYEMIPFRKTIIFTNTFLAIACMFFAVGSILFKDEDSETIGLYREGVIMFIVGSIFFLFGAITGVVLRRARFYDPLHDYRKALKSVFTKKGQIEMSTISSSS